MTSILWTRTVGCYKARAFIVPSGQYRLGISSNFSRYELRGRTRRVRQAQLVGEVSFISHTSVLTIRSYMMIRGFLGTRHQPRGEARSPGDGSEAQVTVLVGRGMVRLGCCFSPRSMGFSVDKP